MNDLNEELGLSSPITGNRSLEREKTLLEDPFSYQGYQVVRREFFAHIQEPAITFNRYQIYANSVCLKKMPQIDYVQILVNPETKKLVVRPCGEDEKDSFLWRSNGKSRHRPKQITCRVFYAKIMELMDWNPELRYRLLGKLIHSNDEQLLLFDLTAPLIFRRVVLERGLQKNSRTPAFPAEWKSQFGLPVEEHRRSLQIDLFQGYAVFGIRLPAPSPPPAGLLAETDNTPLNIWLTGQRKDGVPNVL